MTSDDIGWLDATAQADLVRRGEVTAAELVDAAIERIERLNPDLNAVVTPMFDEARAAARGPLSDAPFKGVPFLLKDFAAEYGGVSLREGSRFLDGFVSDRNTEIVIRYERSGLIVLGKTNTSEFGLLPTAEPELFGPTRNPWDTERTTGGSSGGSAAAVAAGMVPMAHANDGGGSIRIPASCCGLFGLKPTRGRNTLAPHYGDMSNGIVAEHAVTRSVRDSAVLLDTTAGPAPGDPYYPPRPERLFIQEVGADPGRLRIAFSAQSVNGAQVHADCSAAVADAAKLCEGLGHTVEEAAPAVDGERLTGTFSKIWTGFLGWVIADWSRRLGREPAPEHFEPWTWRMYEVAREMTAGDYLMAVQDVQAVARDVAPFFETYDVWLTPAVAQPPLPLGSFAWSHERRREARAAVAQFSAFTPLCNATGQPAMSVPLTWNDAGLPIGSHFVGRYGDEATLFRLAAQLEAERPWADRRPPVTSAAAAT